MYPLLDFLFISDPNVRNVLLGTLLLSTSSAMIGTFALLKKKTLACDAISHAVLPGTCLAFLLIGEKNTTFLIIGAFITGWLASIAIRKIQSESKLKQDSAIAIVSSVSFGFGNFLLSILQHHSHTNQSGLKSFLLGNAATLLMGDVVLLMILNVVIIFTLLLFFKEFMVIAFDTLFAKSIGIAVKKMDFLFTTLLVLAIIIGIRSVGVVLMSAMLITPATIALFLTANIKYIMLTAIFVSCISSCIGIFISYKIPYMPTGPWIVLVMSVIAYVVFLISWYYHKIKGSQTFSNQ